MRLGLNPSSLPKWNKRLVAVQYICIPRLRNFPTISCAQTFVKKCLPALRLSVRVVKTLALAASVGFPLVGVLKDIELPDLESLEIALQEGLDAEEKKAIK